VEKYKEHMENILIKLYKYINTILNKETQERFHGICLKLGLKIFFINYFYYI